MELEHKFIRSDNPEGPMDVDVSLVKHVTKRQFGAFMHEKHPLCQRSFPGTFFSVTSVTCIAFLYTCAWCSYSFLTSHVSLP
jgi:hypothetical protein